jgi:hypothetical protein
MRIVIVVIKLPSIFLMEDGYVHSARITISVGESNAIDVINLRLRVTSMENLNICLRKATHFQRQQYLNNAN